MKQVLVVYPYLSHYRAGVFDALAASPHISLTFAADTHSGNEGIPVIPTDHVPNFFPLRNRWAGHLLWQRGVIGLCLRQKADTVIFTGSAYYLSTWLGAIIARVRGMDVLFWTIGWHRPERGIKRLTRNIFYRLANHLLVYGEIGRELGVRHGYPAERMTVVYNSIDRSRERQADAFEPGWLDSIRHEYCLGAVVRLTPVKELALLVEAIAVLRSQGSDACALFVGEGPERQSLESLAARRNVPLFMPGAAYSDNCLAAVYSRLDATVVPGAIGLTAIQSLAHGTPVVTHDVLHEQMPEVESVRHGSTGAFFKKGSVEDLASQLVTLLRQSDADKARTADSCLEEIATRWNPQASADRIIQAITRAAPLTRGGAHRQGHTRLSVCMAAYNGADHISEQVSSILEQLGPSDELVIVDDASTDSTVEVINRFTDARIHLFRNDRNMGYIHSFELAITRSTGDAILFSDQDDIWLPGRVDLMLESLGRHGVVASNLTHFGLSNDTPAPRLMLTADTGSAALRNLAGIMLGRRPYFGCAMGVSREFAAFALPFPRHIQSHDLWFAIAGNVARNMGHVEDFTVSRRIHSRNLSSRERRRYPAVALTRIRFTLNIGVALWRLVRR